MRNTILLVSAITAMLSAAIALVENYFLFKKNQTLRSICSEYCRRLKNLGGSVHIFLDKDMMATQKENIDD